MDNQSVAQKWKDALKDTGYEHGAISQNDCAKLKRFGRVWRRILRYIKLSPAGLKIFEAGCGGAKHLVPFVLNGARATGLDFSPEVLMRAQAYINEVEKVCGRKLSIELTEGDFLTYKPVDRGSYDLVFHSGVIEHFLDDEERFAFLRNMFALTDPGGYVISIVPSGVHPLRAKMKELKLGGYGIPEVDYSPSSMQKEFEKCGAEDVRVLPHNIFGYLLIDNSTGMKKIWQKLFFYFFQLIPVPFLPKNFAVRHAGTLIGMAKV